MNEVAESRAWSMFERTHDRLMSMHRREIAEARERQETADIFLKEMRTLANEALAIVRNQRKAGGK